MEMSDRWGRRKC